MISFFHADTKTILPSAKVIHNTVYKGQHLLRYSARQLVRFCKCRQDGLSLINNCRQYGFYELGNEIEEIMEINFEQEMAEKKPKSEVAA